jgi:protein gp37
VSDGSAIEWTDASWNPIRGCSRVSAGCEHCYAEVFAARFSGPGRPFEGLTRRTPGGPRWTGKIRLVPEALDQPLRWRRPRRIFVNSMSDLFHEDVPFEFILAVLARCSTAQHHTFQILTKRPARMLEFFRWMDSGDAPYRVEIRENTWGGVSVEDQPAADERILPLLASPFRRRFLSCEPLLGPVDLRRVDGDTDCLDPDDTGHESGGPARWIPGPAIDWVIVGGESGRGARLMEETWARSLVEQCRGASVPVFVKQMGTVWARESKHWPLGDSKGAAPEEWPEDLRVRQMPEVHRA